METDTKKFLPILIPLIVIIVFSYVFQTTFLSNQEQFTTWLRSFGPLIVLIYIPLQWLAIIVAPISGYILYLVVIGLFGPLWGYILLYLVTTPAFCVNFLLAKRYGRPLVVKVIGSATMEKIDHYVADAGLITLFFLKILLSGQFDYISYVLGLTRISFKTFALVNFLGGLPGIIFGYFIFSTFENFTQAVIINIIIAYLLVGSAILINHWREKRRKGVI